MTEALQDLQEIRTLARDFAATELRPHTERWDHDRSIDPAALAQLAELGFFGMLVPEEFGGMGFDVRSYTAVLEELAWGEPAAALTVAVTTVVAELINRFGTPEQKRRWLEPMARGEVLGCLAMSEELAGSDAGALAAVATQQDSGWTLSGSKRWVTNGRLAQLSVVLARTANGTGARGIGAFLVPTDTPGYVVSGRESTLGFRPLEIVSVELDNLRLDADSVLGAPQSGLLQTTEVLEVGRLGIAAISVGIARAALDHALAYADQREQFNAKLRNFEGIQFKLADMATRVEASRALLETAATEGGAKLACMAKLFASESAMWVTTQAVQIFGGYGYMRDYPVEKLMRDAKAMEILEGTSEIQRVQIAKELYRQG